jgi:hypothetical protein
MAIGNYAGRARANSRQPSAQGECDDCGFWYPLDRLSKQFEWRGVVLADTGYLKCPRCLDVPQEQYKTVILPIDPRPRVNPRPSIQTTPMGILPANYGAPPPFPTFPQNNPAYPSTVQPGGVFVLDDSPFDNLDSQNTLE